MKTKIKVYTLAILVSILLVGVGVAFAYFTTNIINEASADVTVELSEQANISFSKDLDLAIEATNANFGVEDDPYLSSVTTPSATLTATGNYTATYYVYFDIKENDFVYTSEYAELILVIDGPNGEVTSINGLEYVTGETVDGFDLTEARGVYEISIEDINVTDGEITEDWTFTLYFINLATNQNDNAGRTFDSTILLQATEYGNLSELEGVESEMYEEGSLAEAILLNNSEYYGTNASIETALLSIYSKNRPDFETIATTDEGMFAAEDNYGTSYYFRGYVEDNYVTFANMLWRIVRIDGEGNVKLILMNEDVEATSYAGMDNKAKITYNSYGYEPEYLGYMYTEGEYRGNSTSSEIKIAIDEWFEGNLIEYETYISTSAIYCSDRTSYIVDGSDYIYNDTYFTGTQYFGANKRLAGSYGSKIEPSLYCEKEDSFTLEDTDYGNGDLNYGVALISADEMALAGAKRGDSNSNFYLFTGYYSVSMSPNCINLGGISYIFRLNNLGALNGSSTLEYFQVNPVISLNSNTTLSSGDCSLNNPYIIN